MISTKAARCARYCWLYVSKYGPVRPRDIVAAQLDYDCQEVLAGLRELELRGYVEHDAQWLYTALVPFVVTL